ncbi:hypothetical protein Lal_00007122 [Lupinus albus]|nr:hypothetical protein Lal_00007122 [Lupinus albus]
MNRRVTVSSEVKWKTRSRSESDAGKIAWRTEPVNVEKFWDEMWIGVKCQSNVEIAGSPRNSFRASLRKGHNGYRTQSNCEWLYWNPGSQTANDKIRSQEGNSPDHQLRSLMPC